MPPVFSPVSLSPERLWSMEEIMGITHSPSVKESTETSGPSRNSSMTILSPLLPNFLSSMISLTAASASDKSWAMMTPFPSARPSALTTVGMGAVCRYARAASMSSKTS